MAKTPCARPSAVSPDEADWAEPRATLSAAIAFARSVGARSIYMVTGGRQRHQCWEEAAEVFSAIVAPCLPEAKAAGVPLLIEPAPFVYSPVHLAHSLRDTVTLAEMAGIGVCIDLFSSWWEADLKASIERAMPICQLVQVGDYKCGDNAFPCRAVPGDGDIPLRQLCEWIIGAGYRGGFDFELIGPRIDQEGHLAAVKRAGLYMTKVLEDLGA
jgi:sugar phosphate isomerase/epimerase